MRVAALAALSGALGLALLLAIGGKIALDPRNTLWLQSDIATSYLGWAFYRRQECCAWPITWTAHVGYPVGVSMSQFDSIPLLGLFFKALDPWLPRPFQYMGIWLWICASLQFFFAWTLLWEMGVRRRVLLALGALLFLFSPLLAYRMTEHMALSAHFVILAALTLYFSRDRLAGRWLPACLGLLFLAGGINPYIGVMAAAVLASAALADGLGTKRWGKLAFRVGAMAATLGGAFVLFGFWTPGLEPNISPFGVYTMNGLSFFDPMGSSLMLKAIPQASSYQHEGYGYLGLGCLLLWVAVAGSGRIPIRKLATARLAPLVLCCAVLLWLALGLSLTMADQTWASWHYPAPVEKALGAFRGSGRFLWPAHLMLTAAVVVLAAALPARRATALLALAVTVQAVDLFPLWQYRRELYSPDSSLEWREPLRSPIWRELGRTHKRLLAVPPQQCGADYGGVGRWDVFGMLADQQGLDTNVYYAARYGIPAQQFHCQDYPARVRRGELDPEAAYVLGTLESGVYFQTELPSHQCGFFDGYMLCYSRELPPPAAENAVGQGVPEFPEDGRLDFSKANPDAERFRSPVTSWHGQEDWGSWAAGPGGTLFRVPESLSGGERTVEVHVQAMAAPGQQVVLSANGADVHTQAVDPAAGGLQDYIARFPMPALREDRLLMLHIRAAKLVVPGGVDPRKLGAGVIEIRIVDPTAGAKS
ncbi:MAG: hypothetical protein H6509_13700 [Bryobacterales bacterium]|nr:hypothetical protein [Bryobacterales bacterium]